MVRAEWLRVIIFHLGYDGIGSPHTNKVTGEDLMPHAHDPSVPRGVRVPYPDEIPY